MTRLVVLATVVVLLAISVVVVCWRLTMRAPPEAASDVTAGNKEEITSSTIGVLQAETFELRLRQALHPFVRYGITYSGNLGRTGRATGALGHNANSWEVWSNQEGDSLGPHEISLYTIVDLVGITTDAEERLRYTMELKVPNTRTQDELKELLSAMKTLGTVNITRF